MKIELWFQKVSVDATRKINIWNNLIITRAYIQTAIKHFLSLPRSPPFRQREGALDSTCEEGSFYLKYMINSPSSGALDYTRLPDVFKADGTSTKREQFESKKGVSLCDDPCIPARSGSTCRSLSCYEASTTRLSNY